MATIAKVKEKTPVPRLVMARGPGIQTRIAVEEFKGATYIDVRTWWRPEGEQEFRPTKKGVSIPAESLPRVIETLAAIQLHLEARGG